jgi:hypothetical protein
MRKVGPLSRSYLRPISLALSSIVFHASCMLHTVVESVCPIAFSCNFCPHEYNQVVVGPSTLLSMHASASGDESGVGTCSGGSCRLPQRSRSLRLLYSSRSCSFPLRLLYFRTSWHSESSFLLVFPVCLQSVLIFIRSKLWCILYCGCFLCSLFSSLGVMMCYHASRYFFNPCRCLTPNCQVSQKRPVCFSTISTGTIWHARAVINGPFFLVLSLAGGGREGHCDHVGALACLIYDASARPMVVDSMD